MATASYVSTVWLRRLVALPWTDGRLPLDRVSLEPWPWLFVVAASALLAHELTGTYDEPAEQVRDRGGLLIASIVAAPFLVSFFFLESRALPRTVLVFHVLLSWGLSVAWRFAAERIVPIGIRRVLVLGTGEDARRAAAALESGDVPGHQLLAWERELASAVGPGGAAALLDDAQDVVFAPGGEGERGALVPLLERSLDHDFDLWLVPGLADVLASRVAVRSLGDLPLARVSARGAGLFARACRRTIDLTAGTALLVVTSPLLALASLAVVLESRGPAWISQERIGRGGLLFRILKVRTMHDNAEEQTGPVLAGRGDPRQTRIGAFLRRTRVDELPQLLLVVRGTMSLIGPRPERPAFVALFEKEMPAYRLRHLLKPGITGLAQVMGAYATRPDVKLRYDLGYLFHWHPGLDLFVLVRTISAVLKATGV